jgi:hypothetical protein
METHANETNNEIANLIVGGTNGAPLASGGGIRAALASGGGIRAALASGGGGTMGAALASGGGGTMGAATRSASVLGMHRAHFVDGVGYNIVKEKKNTRTH